MCDYFKLTMIMIIMGWRIKTKVSNNMPKKHHFISTFMQTIMATTSGNDDFMIIIIIVKIMVMTMMIMMITRRPNGGWDNNEEHYKNESAIRIQIWLYSQCMVEVALWNGRGYMHHSYCSHMLSHNWQGTSDAARCNLFWVERQVPLRRSSLHYT